MPDEKKYLKQWRDGNDLYYFYDEDAHTELNAVSSELATKIAAEDVYDKTSIDEKVVELQNIDNENSLKITSLESILEANKIFATIKSVPTHGIVTMVDGTQLNVKDTLLVSKDSIPYSNGLGQVIFNVKMEDGYRSIVSVKDDEGYKNIKEEITADGSTQYKITKIHDEININIGEEEITEEPNGYRVDFVGEHFSVKYLAVDKNVESATDVEINGVNGVIRTYTRNYDNNGVYAKYVPAINNDPSTEVKPQVQFIVIPDEGYEILSVEPSPGKDDGFKNDKSGMNGDTYVYKYTVIKKDLKVTITTGPANRTLADYHITNAYTKDEVTKLLGELKAEILNKINLPTFSGKYTLTVSGEGDSLTYTWEKVQDPSTGEETV